jgi:hypothetical protein
MKNTDALELLEQGIKNLANQDNWLNHLKTQAVFHSYSFNNTCLRQGSKEGNRRLAIGVR